MRDVSIKGPHQPNCEDMCVGSDAVTGKWCHAITRNMNPGKPDKRENPVSIGANVAVSFSLYSALPEMTLLSRS